MLKGETSKNEFQNENYTTDVHQNRLEFYRFLCEDSINPKQVLLKGRLKSPDIHRLRFRGLCLTNGYFHVNYYFNGTKYYFHSFQDDILAARFYDII